MPPEAPRSAKEAQESPQQPYAPVVATPAPEGSIEGLRELRDALRPWLLREDREPHPQLVKQYREVVVELAEAEQLAARRAAAQEPAEEQEAAPVVSLEARLGRRLAASG